MFYTTTDCDVQWDMYIFDFFWTLAQRCYLMGFTTLMGGVYVRTNITHTPRRLTHSLHSLISFRYNFIISAGLRHCG